MACVIGLKRKSGTYFYLVETVDGKVKGFVSQGLLSVFHLEEICSCFAAKHLSSWLTTQQIATEMGCAIGTVNRVLSQFSAVENWDTKQGKDGYDSIGEEEIAREMGISQQRVSQVIKNLLGASIFLKDKTKVREAIRFWKKLKPLQILPVIKTRYRWLGVKRRCLNETKQVHQKVRPV